ncbi:MAG TPA: hypothetical protein VHI76_03615 [Solirubrobacterales bacterium]|nr:hypothetical protein [Solirubrobacterales bacterium]
MSPSRRARVAPRPRHRLVALVALDAVLPIAPSETLVVAGGVLAADGALSLPLLSAAAATGALTGHTVLYLLGRWAPIDPNAAVR